MRFIYRPLPLLLLLFCLPNKIHVFSWKSASKARASKSQVQGRLASSCLVSFGLFVGVLPTPLLPFELSRPPIASAAEDKRSETIIRGITSVEGEAARIFRKARQIESDSATGLSDKKEAQELYEQLVEAEPTFIYAWSNLGNVLVSEGFLDDALLCYKKAISLSPPRDSLGIILLNQASVEMSLGQSKEALRDLMLSERISGPLPAILTNKAVLLSNQGKWDEAAQIFEKVISTADRNALPWWLRYSQSLLETGRGIEAVAFLQRTLNRFPEETECKAFAVALYSSLGTKIEGQRYWLQMSPEEREMYSKDGFVKDKLLWGPKSISSFRLFLTSGYASTL